MSAGEFDPRNTGRSHATKGVLITGIAQAWRLGLGFLSGIVLARLLTPSDFGLLGMVAPAVALVAMVQDLGIGQAVVQRPTVTRAQISALFYVTLAASFVLAGTLALSAPLLADFYGDARIVEITIAFAGLLVLWTLQAQPAAILARRMQFVTISVIDITAATVGFAVAAWVAYVYETYWALYIHMLVIAIINVSGIWISSRWFPSRPSFEGAFKEIMGLGAGISGSAILIYLSQNVDKILIGKLHGQEVLGLYDRAYKLLLLPLNQVNAPLGRVIVPLLSRLIGNGERYRNAYLEVVTLMLTVTQPGILLVVIFAEDLFRVLLGPQWVAAAPIFQWLGLCALHQVMTATMGWLLFSQGRGGDLFKMGVLESTVAVVSILAGLYWGAVGVAMAFFIGDYLVRLPLAWILVGRLGPISTRDFVRAAVPHMAATLAAAAILLVAQQSLESSIGVVEFIGLMVLSYLVYMPVLVISRAKRQIFEKNLQTALSVARRMLHRTA